MNLKDGFSWECECGTIEYGEYPPKECKDCQGIESFVKIPDEIAEQMEAKKILSVSSEEGEGEDEDEDEEIEHD
jgi:hypothetical protein